MKSIAQLSKRKLNVEQLNLHQFDMDQSTTKMTPGKRRKKPNRKNINSQLEKRKLTKLNAVKGKNNTTAWIVEDNEILTENSSITSSDDELQFIWIPQQSKNPANAKAPKVTKLQKIKGKPPKISAKPKIISCEVFPPPDKQNCKKVVTTGKNSSIASDDDNGRKWIENMTVDVIVAKKKQTATTKANRKRKNTKKSNREPEEEPAECNDTYYYQEDESEESEMELNDENFKIDEEDRSKINPKRRIGNKPFAFTTTKAARKRKNTKKSNGKPEEDPAECNDTYYYQEDESENSEMELNDENFKIVEEDRSHIIRKRRIGKNSFKNVNGVKLKKEAKLSSNEKCYDIDEDAFEFEEDLSSTVKKLSIDDNLRCRFYCSIAKNLVLVLLKSPIHIYGSVCLKLMAGKVDVYGYTMTRKESVEIYAANGYGMVPIQPIPSLKKKPTNFKCALHKYRAEFHKRDLNELKELFVEGSDAVIILKQNEECAKIRRQFENFMNENFFPTKYYRQLDRSLQCVEYILQANIHTITRRNLRWNCLRCPEAWKQFEMQSDSRVMLVGGKSVGKSTLVRYLCNQNLKKHKRILLIDLDIGQSEMFVPQTISCTLITKPLIGPGFLLNLQPDKAFVIGHTNINLCADYYLQSVYALIDYCMKNMSTDENGDIPWIVNTMGYSKGFGMELIASILIHLPITDLIQLQCTRDINNYDGFLQRETLQNIPQPHIFMNDYALIGDYKAHMWPAYDGGLLGLEPLPKDTQKDINRAKDMRYAMILARLVKALGEEGTEWLSNATPLYISFDNVTFVNLVQNVCYPKGSEEESNLMEVADANLVYLCHHEQPKEVENIKDPIECYGIGIVRCVDYYIDRLYLFAAVDDLKYMENVNCLAICEMPLPSILYKVQGPLSSETTPYVTDAIDDSTSKVVKHFHCQV